MASYHYPNAPPYQRRTSYSAENPPSGPYALRQIGPETRNARPFTPLAAPLPQDPPLFNPMNQRYSPAQPFYTQAQQLTPHAPIPQSYQQIAIIPAENQMTHLAPPPHHQIATRSPVQYVGTTSDQPGSCSRPANDHYNTALVPPQNRRWSSSSAPSYHSRRGSYSPDDSVDDHERERSDSRDSRRDKKHKKMKRKEIAALDRKPSYGDTVMMVWDVLKDAVTVPGRRE